MMHILLFLLHLRTGNIFVFSDKGNCISFVAWFFVYLQHQELLSNWWNALWQFWDGAWIGWLHWWYMVGKTRMEVKQNMIDKRAIPTNLSYIINYKSSVFNPTQKLSNLKNLCNNILSDSSGILTVQTMPEFLVTLETYSAAVEYGQCFRKISHIEKKEALKKSKRHYKAFCTLPQRALENIVERRIHQTPQKNWPGYSKAYNQYWYFRYKLGWSFWITIQIWKMESHRNWVTH